MENYLMHHGILGQKWGVRRYQNKDGSLTKEGRSRYGIGTEARDNFRAIKKNANTTMKNRLAKPLSSKEESRYRILSKKSEWERSIEGTQNEYEQLAQKRREKSAAAVSSRINTVSAARKEYHETDEYKARRALTVGASIAGTVLATYGAVKLGEYVADQKTIMKLRGDRDISKMLADATKAEFEAFKSGNISMPYIAPGKLKPGEDPVKYVTERYQKSISNHLSEVDKYNSDINKIASNYLVNFGKHMSAEQYEDAINAAKDALDTGKNAVEEIFKWSGSALLVLLKGV